MYKLRATILKDLIILSRDKVGLIIMFVMPIILAIVITATQNSTFELVNNNKVPLLLCNKDSGAASKELMQAVIKIGMFDIKSIRSAASEQEIEKRMHDKDALVALVIPANFSVATDQKAISTANKTLHNFGLTTDSMAMVSETKMEPIQLMYHPVLQASFRQSINAALQSALQMVQSKQVLKSIYFSLNEKQLPDSLEREIISKQADINEITISRDGTKTIPNATQHNIPAWTIFAMFFVVISLGSSVVREKLNGSFIRLKTLPTNYHLSLISKQITYLLVTLFQAVAIFSIGMFLFPLLGLPKLNLPLDLLGLITVTLICGVCAVSFAIVVGVFAQTQEQANGVGAVSIVMMAAVGGLMVPSFAMPAGMQHVIQLSPLHWCLQAYYGLFLEGGKLKDVLLNILPLIGITVLLQLMAWYGLKRKNLI